MPSSLLKPKDIAEIGIIIILGIISAVTPAGKWRPTSRWIASIVCRMLPGKIGRITRINTEFQQHADVLGDMKDIKLDFVSTFLEMRIILSDHYLLKKWKPNISVSGSSKIIDALKQGRGVLLWIAPFAFSDLVTKRGLHFENIQIHHLTRPEHGLSNSRFGVSTLNKFVTHIEDRYLKERITIVEQRESEAIFKLRNRLSLNKVVSITVGSGVKNHGYISPFGNLLPISMGPLRLSKIANSPLLPVFTLQKQNGDYEIFIESSINQTKQITDNDIEFALASFTQHFEKYVKISPGQLRGYWHSLSE